MTPPAPRKAGPATLERGSLTITGPEEDITQLLTRVDAADVAAPPPALPPAKGRGRRWPPEGGKRRILYLVYLAVVFLVCFFMGYWVGRQADRLGRRLFGADA